MRSMAEGARYFAKQTTEAEWVLDETWAELGLGLAVDVAVGEHCMLCQWGCVWGSGAGMSEARRMP